MLVIFNLFLAKMADLEKVRFFKDELANDITMILLIFSFIALLL